MRAHIVGGGFGGLAAAALLIRNAGMSGQDITIYEADDLLGGGFFLGGNAESGYNLPGSVFDKDSRNSRCESTVPPRTSMFFSGSRLPLATESSMELQSSFFAASSFLLSEPVDALV